MLYFILLVLLILFFSFTNLAPPPYVNFIPLLIFAVISIVLSIIDIYNHAKNNNKFVSDIFLLLIDLFYAIVIISFFINIFN